MVLHWCPSAFSGTAPYSFTRSSPRPFQAGDCPRLTADASETSPCRTTGHSSRRARAQTGHGDPEATAEGSETLVRSGQLQVLRPGTVRSRLGGRAASVAFMAGLHGQGVPQHEG